jgi:hypothetical protein
MLTHVFKFFHSLASVGMKNISTHIICAQYIIHLSTNLHKHLRQFIQFYINKHLYNRQNKIDNFSMQKAPLSGYF